MNKKSIYKQIIIGLLLILGSYLIWYFSQILLNDYPYSFFHTITLLIIYWIVLLAIWSIALFFIKETLILLLAIIISSILSIILCQFNIYFIFSLLIIFLVSIMSHYEVQRDIKSRIKVSYVLSLSGGLKKMILPTILTLTIMFYISPQSANPKIIFPDKLKNWVCSVQIPSTYYNLCQIPDLLENRIFNMIIPGINPNSTIDDLVDDSLAQSYNLGDNKEQFVKEIKPTLPPELITTTREKIIKSLGLDPKVVTGSTQLKDSKVISNLIKKRVGNVQKSETLLKLVYSLIFFEIAMFLSKILLPLSILIFGAIYYILIKTHFVLIEKNPAEVEKIKI